MKNLISALFLTVILSAAGAGARAEGSPKSAALASLLDTSGTQALSDNIVPVPARAYAYSADEMASTTRGVSGVAELISGLRAAQRSCIKGTSYNAECVDTATNKAVSAIPFLFRPAATPYVNRIKGCKTSDPALYSRACVDTVVKDIIAAVQ